MKSDFPKTLTYNIFLIWTRMDRIEDNILIFVSGSTSFVPTRKKQLSLLKYTCRSFYLVQLDEKRGMRGKCGYSRSVDNARSVHAGNDNNNNKNK